MKSGTEKYASLERLERMGYVLSPTKGGGILAERSTFWGNFSYDAERNIDNSRIYWGRFILSFFVIGILGGLWWLYKKGKMRGEVYHILQVGD